MNAVNRALRYALPNLSTGLGPLAPRCSSAKCRPRTKFLSLSFRSRGTSIDQEWYCGPDCYEEAAKSYLTDLCSARRPRAESRRPRMPLGLTLLSLGHIVSHELQVALEFQRQNGGRIGEVLIALGFSSQAQITAALAAQWGYPVLSLHDRKLQVPHMLPTRLMELYSMLPVQFIARTNKLVLGLAEFVEHRVLSTIETMLDCTVVPCFITRDEFDSQFQSVR